MQIDEVLNSTADFKNSIQSRGEIIADRLTLPTIGFSLLALPFVGSSSALAVLTNTFGYKMRTFGPASMLAFLNIASQKGILIKDGYSLDLLGDIDTIVFDKTGTLPLDISTVHKVHACRSVSELDALTYAATAENGQTHPIAKAILAAAQERDVLALAPWATFFPIAAISTLIIGVNLLAGTLAKAIGLDRRGGAI